MEAAPLALLLEPPRLALLPEPPREAASRFSLSLGDLHGAARFCGVCVPCLVRPLAARVTRHVRHCGRRCADHGGGRNRFCARAGERPCSRALCEGGLDGSL